MPARKRHKPGGAQPPTEADLTTRSGRRRAQEEAARQFATRRHAEKDEERARARAHREAAEREERRRSLSKEKDRAADRLKEVRRRGGSAEQRATAEAEYRLALEAVLRDEQGLPPLTEEEAQAEVAEAEAEATDGAGDEVAEGSEAEDQTADEVAGA